MFKTFQLTFEQQPPKIKDNITPIVSHCGIVSMKIRPARAIALENMVRSSCMPYNSAFSSDGAALITLGTITSPSEVTTAEERPAAAAAAAAEAEALAWRSRRVVRRRLVDCTVIGCELELHRSVWRLLGIVYSGTQERRGSGQARAANPATPCAQEEIRPWDLGENGGFH